MILKLTLFMSFLAGIVAFAIMQPTFSKQSGEVLIFENIHDWPDLDPTNSWEWTEETLSHIESNSDFKTPKDILVFCPKYNVLSKDSQDLFWTVLVATIARYESFFDTELEHHETFKNRHGNFVVSRGLMQISFESAKDYGCMVNSPDDLHDPMKNIHCSVKILNKLINKYGFISNKMGSQWLGAARYWGTLRRVDVLSKIMYKTSSAPICGGTS